MAIEEYDDPLLKDEENRDPQNITVAKGHPWMLYLSTSVAVCGFYQIGTWGAYSSPTQSAITEDLSLTTAEYSFFVATYTFGGAVGALTSGPIADLIGRKRAMSLYSGLSIAGWLFIYFAQDALTLDTGRLVGGCGAGALSYVAPVYIAEIAPPNQRGLLSTLNLVMMCTALSISYNIGLVVTWRALALTGIIPSALLLLGVLFIPESPRWLAKREEQGEFQAALQKLRGRDVDISFETKEIQNYIEELKKFPKASLREVFQRRYQRSHIIGIGIMICQQFGGSNGIVYYLSSIFESAGFSNTVGTIIYSIVQVLTAALGAILMDRAGRKPLVLISSVGLVAACILTALSYYLEGHNIATSIAPALALTGILVYRAFYCIGMTTVPWLVVSEIYPINIKGSAGSLATLVTWLGAWLIAYTFSFLMEWSTYGKQMQNPKFSSHIRSDYEVPSSSLLLQIRWQQCFWPSCFLRQREELLSKFKQPSTHSGLTN